MEILQLSRSRLQTARNSAGRDADRGWFIGRYFAKGGITLRPGDNWHWDYVFAVTAGEVIARNGSGGSAVLGPGEAVLLKANEDWSIQKLRPTEGVTLQPTEGDKLDAATVRQEFGE
jgi:hypothetical protein